MDKKWKVALVGLGNWAETVYLPQMKRIENAELVCLCTRNEERLNMISDKYGVAQRFTDWHKMIEEGEFDILMNITPIAMHHEINMAALNAGKHVYSQKPFAQNVHDATLQIEAAEKNNVKFSTSPIHNLRPVIRQAKRLIQNGTIGDVVMAKVSTAHGGPEYFQFRDNDPSWFFKPDAGALLDMGVHGLTVITSLMGPAREMSCMAYTGEPEREQRSGKLDGLKIKADYLPDSYIFSFSFKNGGIGTADVGYGQKAAKLSAFEIYGTKGTICIPHRLEERMQVYIDSKELGLRGWMDPMPMEKEDAEEFFQCKALADLIDSIEKDRAPLLSPYQSRHVIEIMEKTPKAIAEKRTIQLETSF